MIDLFADPYKDAVADRRYAGTILLDNKEVGVTRQCCHCGCHVLSVKGSGKIRGWCMRCNGWTCGPNCPTAHLGCVPFETLLEVMEGKYSLSNIPIIGRVEAEPPKG